MTCKVEDCNRAVIKLGMCQMHYMRMRRHGTTTPTWTSRKCSIPECTEIVTNTSGMCIKHRQQKWYLSTVGREELLERPSQERWINVQSGYVMVKYNGKLDYEHRVIAEKALGKPLPSGAIVHHTGARGDNHGFCKLVICPNQEYHKLIHKRMKDLGYENY